MEPQDIRATVGDPVYHQQMVVHKPQPVTFEAEKRLKHAATLFIVLAYVYLGFFALFLILLFAGLEGLGESSVGY